MSNWKGLETAYVLMAALAVSAALLLSLRPDFGAFDGNDNVATVDGTPIPRAELARALDAMQSGLKRQLNDDDRERALKLLIDEELLVQQALRLELASDDRLIRKNLVQALMNSVTSMDASEVPQDAQLQDFYLQNRSFFARPRQVSLRVMAANDDSEAQLFVDALNAGLSFDQAAANARFDSVSLAAELPLGKIGDLLGGAARDAVVSMQAGDIIGPVESSGRQLYIWMTNDQGGQQGFNQVRDQVQKEWQRRQQEQALERYLDRLRKQARITLHQD
ncbi:MAG: SurA N-terminal domain-containing protein [Arenicella sp.]|nr:SurA N-terminal domain-containing protein [Arenicella sp.]